MASSPTAAQILFSQIEEGGYPFIVSFLNDPARSESAWLEYKGATHRTGEEADDWYKGLWSKYLSGFANTGGGLLIWGIDAQNQLPTHLRLIPDCALRAARLEQLLNNATDPAVANVLIRAYSKPGDTEGLIACIIPESEMKPHQAQWGERRGAYLIRIQDDMQICPQPLLRSLFGQKLTTRFKMHAKLELDFHRMISFTLSLVAIGPASAEELVFHVIPENVSQLSLHSPLPPFQTFMGSADVVRSGVAIPPRLKVPAFRFAAHSPPGNEMVISVYLFCHNSPAQFVRYMFSDVEIGGAAQTARTIERWEESQLLPA
jgi:Putative DNA-binding domain